MATKKEISGLTDQLQTMKSLVETYEEIAALQMRNIRSSVIATRKFIEDLQEVYRQLILSYRSKVQVLMRKKHATFLHGTKIKNEKAACVFISASIGLSGDIIRRTFEAFNNYITTHQTNTDIIIFGKLGATLMHEAHPQLTFTYYELPDEKISKDVLFTIGNLLLQYEKLYIFYERFSSFSSQTPYMLDVYGEMPKVEQAGSVTHYLFEPSLEKILEFFETQIFGTIIQQTFRESELAKYAARMIALDSATGNINSSLHKVTMEGRILNHRLQNQKQVSSFSSMSLWDIK